MCYDVVNSHRKWATATVRVKEPGRAARVVWQASMMPFSVAKLDLILDADAKLTVTSRPKGVVTVYREDED